MASPDKMESEKGDDDSKNQPAPNTSSDWRFNNLTNTSMGLVPAENPIGLCKGDLMESSLCSSSSVVDSYGPNIWDPRASSQNMGFCDVNMHNNASTSSTLGFIKGSVGIPRDEMERALDMAWTPPHSMPKGCMLLPTSSRMLPQSLSQFPTDSGFIERAARFSCLSGGNFVDVANSFSIPESISPYSSVAPPPMQGTQEILAGIRLSSISSGHSLESEMGMVEGSKDVSMPIDQGAIGGSPLNNERKSEIFMSCQDEAKQGFNESDNESDDPEFSNGGGLAEPSVCTGGGTSARGHGLKKRKRNGQKNTGLDQIEGASDQPDAVKPNSEILQKEDPNPTSTMNKSGGKHGKQGSHASDSPKEEYIHVRARRGQATNSHSLAERIRREKISERMKFLQDLVPGCSKVTGKAVMLDEIINYVQSLQRQVEFLSMKLATVNPRMDFNFEGLLLKDNLQSRAAPSSALDFHPDMPLPYAPLHPPHYGLIQAGLPGMGASSDALRRSTSSHLALMSGGYKDPTSQVPNVWEDELHSIVQIGLNTSIPLDDQDLDESGPSDRMKAEL